MNYSKGNKNDAAWEANFIEEDGMVIQPGERKALWGYGANAGNEMSASTEESIQNADWGVLVYIEAAK
ncbi:hypothetical protein [Domibacillus tundrae]|uniref:hypothetical protein n=1 Tax=Domibacillus tundrae TaxID=1587527 RepID=UPI00339721AB